MQSLNEEFEVLRRKKEKAQNDIRKLQPELDRELRHILEAENKLRTFNKKKEELQNEITSLSLLIDNIDEEMKKAHKGIENELRRKK